ncbi:MAG: UDP-glucose 4-epimerase GalE [Candidatus Aminicenantes bacterium]|nr:UDP-glucose 4-epimerase GalE [Candidatus Aminicenantes bacterium]
MKVLVAGGAGYIGSHTVQELLARGFAVVTFDDFSTGRRELIPGGEVIEGDLLDRDAVRAAFRATRFDAVLHFASLIQVGESYRDPAKYYTHNLDSSLNLLDAMREAGVGAFIFSSSAAVYGVPEVLPIPETHPLKPINPYGRTKLFVERILEDYGRAYGLRYVSLRYFNAAGADPGGRRGELHDPETHLIPNLLRHLLGRAPALEVFGPDFPTPDGTAIRDFIHVSDLAVAHVLALEKLLADGESLALNLGASRGYSVLEVIRKAEEVTGRKAAVERRPRREGDVPVLLASKELAERTLGWTLRQSELETIIETAWRWHRSRGR